MSLRYSENENHRDAVPPICWPHMRSHVRFTRPWCPALSFPSVIPQTRRLSGTKEQYKNISFSDKTRAQLFERAARLRRRMTSMKTFSALFLLAVLLSGCTAAFRAGSAVALGRQELFRGQNADALESFEVAVRESPDYSFGIDRPEGVLSYLGRAQYLNGQYAQARQSLERDLARNEGNSLSRLYLGLTLVRLNDREKGLRDIVWG